MEKTVTKLPNPAEIEKSLRRIQSEVSPNEARTSLFNLVIYARKTDRDVVEAAVNGLLGKRPARVIHIVQGESETRVDVNARCVEDWESREVCIQEILIESGPEHAGESPGTWTPLLIKEIPVYIWWLDTLGSKAQDIVNLLEDQSDRLLVDSRTDKSFIHFYQDFILLGGIKRLPMEDISWQRLHPIMKLTAQLFNPPEMREHLSRLSFLQFSGGTASEVFFFFLWMKSKLLWQGTISEFQGALRGKSSTGDNVSCTHLKPGPLEEGFEIEFKTQEGAVLTIKGKNDGTAQLCPSDKKAYTAVFRLPSLADILLKEVDRDSPDRLFVEALGSLQ